MSILDFLKQKQKEEENPYKAQTEKNRREYLRLKELERLRDSALFSRLNAESMRILTEVSRQKSHAADTLAYVQWVDDYTGKPVLSTDNQGLVEAETVVKNG